MEFVRQPCPCPHTSPLPYNALPLENAPAELEAVLEGSEMWVEEEALRRKGTSIWLLLWPRAIRVSFHASPVQPCNTGHGVLVLHVRVLGLRQGKWFAQGMPASKAGLSEKDRPIRSPTPFTRFCCLPENVQSQVTLKMSGLPGTNTGKCCHH